MQGQLASVPERRAIQPPDGRHDQGPLWADLLDRDVPMAVFSSKIGRKRPPIQC